MANQPFKAGFTLVELMIVLAIAGILAAIALPSYRSFVLNQRIKSAALDLYSSAAYARSEAITRGLSVNSVRLSADTSGNHWESGWKVELCNDSTCSSPTLLKNYQSLNNLSITSSSSGGALDAIEYLRSGRIDSSLGMVTFYLTATDATVFGISPRCVSIGLSGQPYMRTDKNKDGNCTNG